MILNVCKVSLAEIVFFISNNYTLTKLNFEINFFNFLNLCFFVNFKLIMIFAETVNLILIEIEALMILNCLNFSFIYVIHFLSSLSFKNFVLKCSLLIFIKKHYHISCFFVFVHYFLYIKDCCNQFCYFLLFKKKALLFN